VTSHPIMPLELQVFGAAVLFGFLARLVYLIRYKRLSLRDSLLWLVSTGVALVFTVFPRSLVWVAGVLEIEVPANALFALAFVYVLLNLLSLTIGLSGNATRVRRLTQECALLRAEIDVLRAEVRERDAGSTRHA
jgi:hypothetical protein